MQRAAVNTCRCWMSAGEEVNRDWTVETVHTQVMMRTKYCVSMPSFLDPVCSI
jgi:hypothetical protein